MPSNGNSPRIWTPSTQAQPLRTVTAGDWIRVDVLYRNTNTMPVVSCQSPLGAAPVGGLFQVHVVYTVDADDSIPHTEGGKMQPTMYGGTSTKRPSTYHIDPGWGFQAPWDGLLSIVSGGDSDPSVQLDVVVRVGMQPQNYSTAPHLVETIQGLQMSHQPKQQRTFAPPVIGHPDVVPATYVFIPSNSSANVVFPRDGSLKIPLPSGATGVQMTDVSGADSMAVAFQALGATITMGVRNGQIEQIGSLGQGGGSIDSSPALFVPVPNGSVTDIYKVTVWSKLAS